MLDLTAFDAALKVRYGVQELRKIGWMNRPLFAKIAKMENFTGRNLPLPILYGDSQNNSADYLTSRRGNSGDPATSSALLGEWILTRKKRYAHAFIDYETIKASADDPGAFARAVVTELDSAVESVSNALHKDLYGDGLGTLGEVGAVAGTVITLTNRSDVNGFGVGQVVRTTQTSTATAILAPEKPTIAAIDRAAGTITLSAAPATLAVGRFIFRDGDRQDAAVTATSQYRNSLGLAAWLPATAPTSGDNFFGVDRSVDPVRLAGNRISWESSYRKTIMKGSIECGLQGASGDKTLFVNNLDMQGIMFEYEGKLEHRREEVKGTFGVGFREFEVQTPEGMVSVVADRQCPQGVGYMLDMSTVKLYSLGGAPHLIDLAGKYQRHGTSDSVEVEFAAFGQMGIQCPGKCARLAFS